MFSASDIPKIVVAMVTKMPRVNECFGGCGYIIGGGIIGGMGGNGGIGGGA